MTEPAGVEREKKAPETGRGLTKIGLAATGVWLAVVLGYALIGWEGFKDLPPNAVGDFLAGAFAPLAFFWLVLGFFQQGAELRNSGEALRLQGEELRNSVAEQRALVAVATGQLELDRQRVEAERQQLDEERERRLVLAEPTLRLSTGASVRSGGTLVEQEFVVANHGATCTGVNVVGPLGRILTSSDRFAAGQRLSATIRANPVPDQIQLDVTYLNEDRRQGQKTFLVSRIGDEGWRIETLPQ